MDDRLKSAIATVLVHGALGYALVIGLAMSMPRQVGDEMTLVNLAPERPPPPQSRLLRPVQAQKSAGRAAPPNIISQPTPIVVPPPVIPPIVSPSIVTTSVAGQGSDATAGTALIPGPGPGAGGAGNGTGSGGFGNGGGGSPPVRTRGRLRNSDFPRAAADAGAQGTVSVRFAVNPAGRVDSCEITRSSGNPALDETTCRLIRQRYRFRPARDERGVPERVYVVENHSWIIERDMAER